MMSDTSNASNINDSAKVAYKLQKARTLKFCDSSEELCLLKSYLHDTNYRFPAGANGVVLYELIDRLGEDIVPEVARLTGVNNFNYDNCMNSANFFRNNNYKSEEGYQKKKNSVSQRLGCAFKDCDTLVDNLMKYEKLKDDYLQKTRQINMSASAKPLGNGALPVPARIQMMPKDGNSTITVNIMSGGNEENVQTGGAGDGQVDQQELLGSSSVNDLAVKGPSSVDIKNLQNKKAILFSYGPDANRPGTFKCATDSSGLPHLGQSDDVDTIMLQCDKVNERKKGYDIRFVNLHNGKFDIYGGTGRYLNMIDFLKHVESSGVPIAYVWAACTQFTLKPTDLIKTGYTKRRKGDGFGFAKEFRHFLPMFDESEIKSPQDIQKFQRRTKYPSWAKYVNKSMCYRICLFYIMDIYESGMQDVVAERDELFDQWTQSLNFNPATVTREILQERMPLGVSSVKDETSIYGGKVGEEWIKIKMNQCADVKRGKQFMSLLPSFDANRHEKAFLDSVFTKKFVIEATVDATNTVQYQIPMDKRVNAFN
jgi:hypothetical protein